MEVLSINLGRAGTLTNRTATWESGIFKQPTNGPVEIAHAGVVGDTIVNTTNHGGPDQAVYVYGRPDYDRFETELGYSLPNGIFGENLTISGFESARCHIGDRLQIGTVVLEVSAPRTPCESLNARMNDSSFVKRFFAADRPGCYCRVIMPGSIQTGDSVSHSSRGGAISIVEAHRTMRPGATHDTATIERFLAEPIHSRLRNYLTGELARRQAAES
jgi:MOSC domain-containing protein YiiM